MGSQVHDNGWISLDVPAEWEGRARAIRAERDQQYGNIYPERETDARWVGELGEIAFRSWLNHRGCHDFQWIQDDAAGKPDFILGRDVTVGVQTVKRKVAPRAGYTMQITAQHAHEPVQQFFFLTYEFQRRVMWLLGGVARDLFLDRADFFRDGDWVHPNYQVRGHDIYNADMGHFTPPDEWLQQVLAI